jgi:hypothetical protein
MYLMLTGSECNDAADRIVRRNPDSHAIARNYFDSETAHAAAQLSEHFMPRIASARDIDLRCVPPRLFPAYRSNRLCSNWLEILSGASAGRQTFERSKAPQYGHRMRVFELTARNDCATDGDYAPRFRTAFSTCDAKCA